MKWLSVGKRRKTWHKKVGVENKQLTTTIPITESRPYKAVHSKLFFPNLSLDVLIDLVLNQKNACIVFVAINFLSSYALLIIYPLTVRVRCKNK